METRRLQYRKYAAWYYQPDEQGLLLDQATTCSNLYDDGQKRIEYPLYISFGSFHQSLKQNNYHIDQIDG